MFKKVHKDMWIKHLNPSFGKDLISFYDEQISFRLLFTYKHWSVHKEHIKYGQQKLKRAFV